MKFKNKMIKIYLFIKIVFKYFIFLYEYIRNIRRYKISIYKTYAHMLIGMKFCAWRGHSRCHRGIRQIPINLVNI